MESQDSVEKFARQPSPQNLLVIGNLKSEEYHKADYVAKLLVQSYPDVISVSSSIGHMEFQWVLYKQQLETNWATANDEEIAVLGTMDNVVIFSQGHLRWSFTTFLTWAQNYFTANLQEQIQSVDFTKKVSQSYTDYISNSKYSYAYMNISLDGKLLGQITFELYKELCPLTCDNFLALCTGEKGEAEDGSHVRLWYISSPIHRIVPNGWIQGGDICSGSGDGGVSIYGPTFSDECFAILHDSRGVLGMVNHGNNTNSSQFYITLSPAKWMDKRYVAFGRVVEGTEVLNTLEKVKTFNERPIEECVIHSCGILTVDDED